MKTRGLLFVLATLGLLMVGCGPIDSGAGPRQGLDDGSFEPDSPYLGTTTSNEPPRLGGRLVYGLPAETNSWNPGNAQWGAYSMVVAHALFDTLFAYDADGNAQPNLVKSFEHNEDFTVWTITLRPGIKFHNGKPLTANDIVVANQLFRSSEVLGGAYNLTALDHSDVLDDLSYRMYTTKPWPTFRDSATSPLSVAADTEWLQSGDWGNPIGTGPFRMEKWDLNDKLLVSRNRDYWRTDRWGNRLPYLDSIEFRVMTNDLVRATALRSGQIDAMMQTLPTAELAELRKDCRAGQLQCFSDAKGETPENFVVLNTTKPPFDDPVARRALAMSVDRDDYVRHIAAGESTPADGIHAPGSPWFTPSSYPGYDLEEARKLIASVQERNGGSFRFELMGLASEEGTRIMQYLQAVWKQAGIEVTIAPIDNRTKIIRQVTGDYQASVTQAFDATHPAVNMAFIDTVVARNPLTIVFSRLDDAELGARIESLYRTPPDPQLWKERNGQVMERLNQLVPFIWLDHAPRTVVARTTVVNVVDATLPDGAPAADFTGGAHAVSQIWLRTA
jgi:peptide/nickel transport system substrate-binding protein